MIRQINKSREYLIIGTMALFVILQLIPYGREHGNPPVLGEPAWDSLRTRTLFMQTCGDCHSNETTWPWYSSIAPVSWLVYHHVEEGRSRFNISAWSFQDNKSGHAVEHYIHGEMPLKSYLFAHPVANLAKADRQALIDGMFATFGSEFHDSAGMGD